MKRKLLFLIMVVALMMAFCISANALEGSGTQADPYIIKSEDDFTQISSSTSAHYKLDADLEFSSDTGAIIESEFKGVFDGNGHTVKLTINALTDQSGDTLDALFALVSGQIKNLTVTGSVNGSNKTAGIVAKLFSSGNIDNCVNYATVYGRKNVAGIAGVLFDTATVTNCKNYGTISGKSINKGVDLGGIVGCVWYTGASHKSIINCYNAGALEGNGSNVGGIVGFFYSGKIENCFSTGELNSTDDNNRGIIFGCTDQAGTHTVDGYFGLGEEDYIGTKNGSVKMGAPMLESTGVAIYLGSGSGIRGEFHLDEDAYNTFCTLVGIDKSNIEYGAVVTTKIEAQALNGNLNSQEAIDGGKVSFAPALKNGEKQYFFVDETKEGYHSYRFALTGFADTAKAYNTEFVILGYVKFIDANENEQIVYVNTVESARLASLVEGTKLNAVNIIRVAEASLEDGDFEGNADALNALNHIVSKKVYNNVIEIDGTTDYGHINATFTSHVSEGDTVVFKINNTVDTEFNDYISELLLNGYEKLMENEVGTNKFFVLKKGSTLINASFFGSNNEATISKETLTALPENLTKPTYTKKNNSSITQIKLADNVSVKEGMSYVIHLEDGTFFIVDGGWCEDNYLEADKLYNVLVDLNGSENGIVIAGWIFTHCHGDHIGTFNYFVEKYHDKVAINQLLYAFPSDDEIRASGSSYMLDDSKQRYGQFKKVIAEYLTDTEIVKIHSGYKFYYANAEIEILQTFEDLYPSSVASYDFNSTSTLFTVAVGGQKIMFLGDVSDKGASRLVNMFSGALECDFVQVAHHGLNTTDTIRALYQAVNPKYALYPACESWYRSNITGSANAWLESSDSVKQIFVSGISTFKLDLPYDGTAFDGKKLPTVTEIDVAQRPSTSVAVPDAYFDLEFVNGTPVDAKGNATVSAVGGKVETTTVEYDGEDRTATAFVKDGDSAHYMTLNFNDITTDAQMGEFVMSSSTFEIFLSLDKLPGKTVGLITSCNGGGVTLYLRQQAGGQITFQIGSTNRNSNGSGNYSSTSDMSGTQPLAYAGAPIHIVGSYDKATNLMSVYINGILVASADYGTGEFLGGSGRDYVLGICYNPQYSNEDLGSTTNYELYEARIYDTALTSEQVAQQYWNCVDNLLVEGTNE
ncbi:MAG: MBL fold metallo-hydrolase [Clostridia bacterium]|nr:MBL fold metallo-hydrolase [Clostridia bacterium]MBQ8739895.1 MBL fold metallo-hydrolase [Clostridia bacterium]